MCEMYDKGIPVKINKQCISLVFFIAAMRSPLLLILIIRGDFTWHIHSPSVPSSCLLQKYPMDVLVAHVTHLHIL